MIRPRIKPHVIWMPGYIIPDKALPFIPKSASSTAGLVERESYALIKRASASSFWAIQKQGK
jgi:hypothetical protein